MAAKQNLTSMSTQHIDVIVTNLSKKELASAVESMESRNSDESVGCNSTPTLYSDNTLLIDPGEEEEYFIVLRTEPEEKNSESLPVAEPIETAAASDDNSEHALSYGKAEENPDTTDNSPDITEPIATEDVTKTPMKPVSQQNKLSGSVTKTSTGNGVGKQNAPVVISFTCDVCGKECTSNSQLEVHKVVHSDVRPFVCKVCNQGYKHRHTLQVHMRKHTGKLFSCSTCGKQFNRACMLKYHENTHEEGDEGLLFFCEVCGKSFRHPMSLSTHRLIHQVGKFPCNMCDKVLSNAQLLKTHKRTHFHMPKTHTCKICVKVFPTWNDFKEHRYKEHKSKICNVCDEAFATCIQLSEHRRIHRNATPSRKWIDGEFKCNVCSKGFSTEAKLTRHSRIHIPRAFQCEECSEKFVSKRSLAIHVNRVHDNVSDRAAFKCGQCGQKFMSKEKVEQHLETNTCTPAEEKPFESLVEGVSTSDMDSSPGPFDSIESYAYACQHCDEIFPALPQLEQHEKHHFDLPVMPVPAYKCDVCDEGFSQEHELATHKSTHSTGKFKCELCSKSYDLCSVLRAHQAISHRNEFPIKQKKKKKERSAECNVCGNVFSSVPQLREHQDAQACILHLLDDVNKDS